MQAIPFAPGRRPLPPPRTSAVALAAALAATLAVALAAPVVAAQMGDVAPMAGMAALAAFQDEGDSAAPTAERAVKAVYLSKFLGYVDFPGGPLDPGAPYVVGVAGAEDVASELARLTNGRLVNNHTVVVRRLHDGDGAAGLHLLFIGAAEGGNEAALIKAAQAAGALSVTESATGIEAGSVINFLLVDDRVRFEVSLAAAERGRLKLSSRLLTVAYAVLKGAG